MEILETPDKFSSISSKKRNKLPSLTFLRFIAASLIVVHHLDFKFIQSHNWFPLDSAVCFFYILSGFILTYSYPTLPDWKSIINFYKARFARIWPIYIVATLIYVVLAILSHRTYLISMDGKVLLFYVTMTQAWIPYADIYFAFIPAAWSISDEFFFYLCFPLLIKNFSSNWYIKFISVLVISIGLVWLSNLLGLPGFAPGKSGITTHGLFYINPTIRILEFIWGMCIALLFQYFASLSKPRYSNKGLILLGTLLELITILSIIVMAEKQVQIISIINHFYFLGNAGNEWLSHGKLLMFPYGILILVFALNAGVISKFVAAPKFIYLGEISFSLYLLHQPCLIILDYLKRFVFLPMWMPIFIYLIIVLVLSHFMFMFVESPGRRLILGFGTRQGSQSSS